MKDQRRLATFLAGLYTSRVPALLPRAPIV
jgi:hypothetical protein